MIPVVLLLEKEKIGRLANLNKNSKKKAKLANLQNKQTNKQNQRNTMFNGSTSNKCLLICHILRRLGNQRGWRKIGENNYSLTWLC